MDFENIFIKLDNAVFLKDKDINERTISLNELIDLCEEYYFEIERLNEKIEDMEQDIEDNYKPISKKEQYDVSDRMFL